MNWLRRLFHKSRAESDLDRELRSHLEQQIAQYIANGLTPAEARRRANLEFGGLERVKEEVRATGWESRLDNLARDFRYAIRGLRKDMRFALVAIFALALGISASTVIFSIFYNLTFNALAAKDANRLVVPVLQDSEQSGNPSNLYISWSDLQFLKEHTQVLENFVGYRNARSILRDGSRTFQFDGALVTPDAFELYGVPAFLGRGIVSGDGDPGAPSVFVMSYGTWKNEFGGNPGIVEKKFVIDGQPRTLVGVMPERFRAFDVFKELFIPTNLAHGNEVARNGVKFNVLARLKQDATVDSASAEFAVLAQRLATMHPNDNNYPKKFIGRVLPASEYLIGIIHAGHVFNSKIDLKSILIDLLAAVLLLVLIACSNVANLLLARAIVREKEIAVRSALGASRGQIVRQLLIESLVMALAAFVAGCSLAWVGMKIVDAAIHQKNWTQIGGEAVIGLNLPVLLFAAGVAVLTTVLCGLLPALHATRRDVQPQLVAAGMAVRSGVRHGMLRAGLVIGQVALSIVLLAGATLMVRSLYKLTHIDLGFDPKNILVMALSPSRSLDQLPDRQLMASPEGEARFAHVVDRIRELPGVESVAVNNTIPAYGPSNGPKVSVPGGTHVENAGLDECDENCADTLGLRLIAGRWLSHDEVATKQFATVLNQRLAHDFFGEENPIGKQLVVQDFAGWKTGLQRSFRMNTDALRPDATFRIVGVVQDVKNAGPQQPAFPVAFIPPMITGSFILQVRTKVKPRLLMHTIQEQIWNADPAQVFWIFDPLDELLEQYTYMMPEFGVALSGPLAGIGLLLVVIGVFSVMAYTVSLQTREIGIRMTLGAQQSNILKSILTKGLKLVGVGIVIGLTVSLALSRFLASQIWGISPTDAWTYTSTIVLVIAVALLACIFPARKATEVDPLVALRYE